MPVTAIVGAQWGDEGKGKITDLLAEQADIVIRFGGGGNAGHTVINHLGEFALHIIPSGIFNPRAVSLVGTGAVVDLDGLGEEMDGLVREGVAVDNLRISSRAQLVMPYHLLLDRLTDEARGELTLGTTRKGIGPAYADKAERIGVRAGDLLHGAALRNALSVALPRHNAQLERFGEPPMSGKELEDRTLIWSERFGEMIVDQAVLVGDALDNGREILLEGQLGTMRDLDWGTYPYVTSSTTIAGGGGVGGGVPPRCIERVVGVVKAYTSAVGTGPVPAELTGTEGDALRRRGNEFGTTTGRPRRVGWFDAVATRYAHRLNRFTDLAITKLDVLDGLGHVKLITAYAINGTEVTTIPDTADMEQAIPIYEEMPGWQDDTSRVTSWSDLPANARRYVQRIEALVGAPVTIVSVGPARQQTIHR